jgi:uncharacterized membrane protein HdeD (DUF308 family)
MVAPDDDFDARPKHRGGRARIVAWGPPQAAGPLLEDRRLSQALRGQVAFLCGIGFLWPAVPEEIVMRLFAAYAFLDGVIALATGGWSSPYRLGWPLLIGGCIDIAIAAAAYLWLWSGMTLGALANLAMLWAIGSGAAYTLSCVTLRDADADQLFLACGIASLIFGRALLSQLAADPIILSTWLGLYAIAMAVLYLKLTLRHYKVILL